MRKELTITTKNANETKKLASLLVQEILASKRARAAIVISLDGDLGSGKTTFTQGFAKGLGIQEGIKSPTFVILKVYEIEKRTFIHIDAYRIGAKDLDALGWRELIKNPKNILLIEWGGRIRKLLPKDTLRIRLQYGKQRSERLIEIGVTT